MSGPLAGAGPVVSSLLLLGSDQVTSRVSEVRSVNVAEHQVPLKQPKPSDQPPAAGHRLSIRLREV